MKSSRHKFCGSECQHQHHGKARVDRARDKVGRENRGVPAGQHGDGEIETHYAMHGEDERRRQAGQQQISRLDIDASAAPNRASQEPTFRR